MERCTGYNELIRTFSINFYLTKNSHQTLYRDLQCYPNIFLGKSGMGRLYMVLRLSSVFGIIFFVRNTSIEVHVYLN